MCSVTWTRDAAGLHVFMNRDERRTRAPERPPRVLARDGVSRIAPEDGEAGGTWIAVNEHGVVVALVNGYLREDLARTDEPRSRGLLVRDLAAGSSSDDVVRRLGATDLSAVRSFRLLVLHPDDRGAVATWDGRSLEIAADAEPFCPLLSSSHAASAVAAARLEAWNESVALHGRDPDALERYHAGHARGESAYSVCMHREDAETRSFVRVLVADTAASLTWSPGPPCRSRPGVRCSVQRVASP